MHAKALVEYPSIVKRFPVNMSKEDKTLCTVESIRKRFLKNNVQVDDFKSKKLLSMGKDSIKTLMENTRTKPKNLGSCNSTH